MTSPDLDSTPHVPDHTPVPAPAPGRSVDPRELALRAAGVTGLGASAILLVDYVRTPVFCGEHGGGCDAVRRWSTQHLGAVTVPILGVLFFAALLALAGMDRNARARRALGALGLAGCATGVALMLLQATVIHALCRYCLVVDVSALVAGILAIVRPRAPELAGAPARRMNLVTAGAAALALVLPLSYGLTRAPERPPGPQVEARVPDAIVREQRQGVATIVEFVDYECPFCRRQQEAMVPVLASYGDRVRLVRRNVPLTGIHPHAHDAARAACCADEQGRGERMAAALFRSDDLTPEGCARIAREIGLDMDGYQACLASQRPDVAIERDHDLARSLNIHGLPTFWIGRERFEGLQPPATVRASIDRALSTPALTSPARTGT